LIAIGQPTPDTPAGRMARNMMAAMGTFFAEQLATDVRDGLARRVRDGWFPTVAPYGYVSRRVEGRSIVEVESREADNVRHIFDLYAFQHCTIDMTMEKLHASGRAYTTKQPHWARSKIHRILRDRSYLGDISWHGDWQPGRHTPLIDRVVFDRVLGLLGDKIYKAHGLVYAGALITCGHCDRPITGEIVEKKSSGKSYIYYRCARYTALDHPRDRLREQDIDGQMMALFEKLRQPEPVQEWFRAALIGATGQEQQQARIQTVELRRQLNEVRSQQDRLLNLHLSGSLDELAFAAKNTELRDRVSTVTAALNMAERGTTAKAEAALRVFELSQSLRSKWVKADHAEKRRIVEMVCLNLVLRGATLGISTRKPFNALVEGLQPTGSGEGGIRTPETVARLQHFQCCSFSRSDTSPCTAHRAGGRQLSRSAAEGQAVWVGDLATGRRADAADLVRDRAGVPMCPV
jgi:site-specific DNA recombinase